MRFTFIDAAKAEFPIQRLCQVLEVSQSGYFAWRSRPACQRQRDDLVLLAHVRSAFRESNGTYGSPRMTRELQDQGLPIGRRRTARLMRENGLKARQKRRFKRTTDSHHAFPIAPNLLEQDFSAERPNQKWNADISYVWTSEGWLYLAVVLDLFARRVVGWAVSDRLHKELALEALRKALAIRRPGEGLTHHADRGSQYCSIEYQAELRKHGIRISMSGKGNCYRQCRGRDLLQDLEIRAGLAHRLPDPSRGQGGDRPLHRRLLQPRPASFDTGLCQSGSVRKAGRIATKPLSTKPKQIQREAGRPAAREPVHHAPAERLSWRRAHGGRRGAAEASPAWCASATWMRLPKKVDRAGLHAGCPTGARRLVRR